MGIVEETKYIITCDQCGYEDEFEDEIYGDDKLASEGFYKDKKGYIYCLDCLPNRQYRENMMDMLEEIKAILPKALDAINLPFITIEIKAHPIRKEDFSVKIKVKENILKRLERILKVSNWETHLTNGYIVTHPPEITRILEEQNFAFN